MTGLELQTVATLFTERLLNNAAEGMLLAGLIWILLRVIGRQGANTRFAIWFSALLAIVALPFFGGSAPLGSPSLAPLHAYLGITLPSSWALYLFAIWASVAGLLLLRLGVGLWHVYQLRNDCSDVSLIRLDPAIAAILREFGSRHRVKLCVSRDVAIPAAIGFFRPVIIFPSRLLPELSAEEIRIILQHEFAHLCRRDHWTNLVQKILTALFFFHPAIWWIDKRLALEREMACDDVVLKQTASPKAYASFLILFSEKVQSFRALELVQGLAARMHQMSLRVTRILDTERPTRSRLGMSVLGLSTGLLALLVGTVPYMPPLVSFQSRGQLQRASTTKVPAQSISLPDLDHAGSAAILQRSAIAPMAIPAAFNPESVPPRLRAKLPGGAVTKRARAVPHRSANHATFIMFSRQYGPSGSEVWTLCIWKVGAGRLTERQLGSAVVLGSI